jgi:hypothetical protein
VGGRAEARGGGRRGGCRHEWLAGLRDHRQRRRLQRRLVAARRGGQGRHLRQRHGGGRLSLRPHRCPRQPARWQQGELHHHLPRRAVAAGERLLVGDDVRRQDAAADREPDRPLPHQLPHAARPEAQSGWRGDALRPGEVARAGAGEQLAAGTGRADLHGDAALLAEDRAARAVADRPGGPSRSLPRRGPQVTA